MTGPQPPVPGDDVPSGANWPVTSGANPAPPPPPASTGGYASAPPAEFAPPPASPGHPYPVATAAPYPGAGTLSEAVAPRPATLGVVALILGLIAAVLIPVIAGFASVPVGRALPLDYDSIDLITETQILAQLSSVSGSVLTMELSFWLGTVAGIAAIVLGIVAAVQKRGRGFGVGAIVGGALGAFVFFIAVVIGITAGVAGNVAVLATLA